jgi:hypothetical protein
MAKKKALLYQTKLLDRLDELAENTEYAFGTKGFGFNATNGVLDEEMEALERFGYVSSVDLGNKTKFYQVTEKGFDTIVYRQKGLIGKAFHRQPATAIAIFVSSFSACVSLVSMVVTIYLKSKGLGN